MTERRYWVGIDIGGTNTKIAIINDLGEISNLNRIYNSTIELTTTNFPRIIAVKALEIIDDSKTKIEGIGISTPGLQMENGSGTLFSINMPILNKFDMKGFFEQKTHLPTAIINDLIANSLAEQKFGAGKNTRYFLNVSIGTGIGHVFIKDGKPVIIANGISGDSGRIILDPNSTQQDSSGLVGTAEALCGVNAIEVLAKEYYQDGQMHDAQQVIAAAQEGKDSIAYEVMTIISQRLALFLVNLSVIYFPEVISITGGQTEAGDFFMKECQKEFDRLSASYFHNCLEMMERKTQIEIVKSKAGGLAGLIGSIVPLID
ncbi:MAG: ROK family protein [Anaerolineales bacterium]|nr:ROK family protein [Anaerolineales bacterium]